MKVTFGESTFVSFLLVFKNISLWNSYSRALFFSQLNSTYYYQKFSVLKHFWDFCLLILNLCAVCKNVAALWRQDNIGGKWKWSRGQKTEQEKTQKPKNKECKCNRISGTAQGVPDKPCWHVFPLFLCGSVLGWFWYLSAHLAFM